MIGYLKSIVIQNIASPTGLAVVSFCIFMCGWAFPPTLYADYIHEPDLMFLNPVVLAFFTLCTVAFLFGVRASRLLGGTVRRRTASGIKVRRPLLYLGVPIFLGTVCCLIYLQVLGGQISFIALLASQDGNAIKAASQSGQIETGRWSQSILTLTLILWWASYRANQLSLKGASKYIFRILFWLGIAANILACAATVDRTNLMPLIGGLYIVFLFWKTYSRNVRIYKVALVALGSLGSAVALFLAIAVLRGEAAIRLLVIGLLGYTIVSYNRMAALLLGLMHDTYEGRGAYLFPVLSKDQMLDSLFHFNNRFDWPSTFSLWLSAFSTVRSASLNPAFNFYSVFGDLYSDLGWYAPVYMLGVGVIVGYLWLRFRAGATSGVVLYPWCAFCILFWLGFNIMFDARIVGFVKLAVVLSIYDRWAISRASQAAQSEYEPTVVGGHLVPATPGLVRGIFDGNHWESPGLQSTKI